jgi:hypothetical protein
MNTKKVFPFLAEDLNLISLRGRKFIGCQTSQRSKMKLQVEFPSSNDPSQGLELSLEEQVGPIFILTVFLLSPEVAQFDTTELTKRNSKTQEV